MIGLALLLVALTAEAQPSPSYVDDMELMRTTLRQRVLNNPDAALLLRGLKQTVRVTPFDAIDPHAEDSGYAWRIASGFLYLFPYRSSDLAKDAERRFAAQSVYGDAADTDSRLYRCRSTVAIYVGREPAALATMKRLCSGPKRPGPVAPER